MHNVLGTMLVFYTWFINLHNKYSHVHYTYTNILEYEKD